MDHSELKKKALKRKDVRVAYEALETEFTLLRDLLKARRNAGLTQAEIAERMGTKAPVVTRLESSLSSGKHSPSVAHLEAVCPGIGLSSGNKGGCRS